MKLFQYNKMTDIEIHIIKYIYIYIYIYIYTFLLCINNLIYKKIKINQNTRKKMLLFVLYCPGLLTVIYNMYKSMTS